MPPPGLSSPHISPPLTAGSVGLHWWTAGLPLKLSTLDVQSVLGPLGKPEGPGGYGHPSRRVHESGAAVYCGSERPDQPMVLNAPGEVCEAWGRQLLEWTEQLGGWATRYDVANDIEPADQARRRLRECDAAFRRGRVMTSMRRTSRQLHQSEDGWTLYLGGPTAALRWVAYDRRGPLRIEMRHRPQDRTQGSRVAGNLLRYGLPHAWRTLASAVSFPFAWYQDQLNGSAEKIGPQARASSSLDDVVAQLRKQWGLTLWALHQGGMTLGDLANPPEALRGSQAARLKSWAPTLDALGYDGRRLRKKVDERCQQQS